MRIAFTHNLQLTVSEEEAEFDTAQTVDLVTRSLRDLGHEVEPVEVSGPASRLVARLEALNPDLVFNTAEGRRGRYREAFYPGLFEQLGIPFSGSDAYVCALTLDKQLTKMVLAQHGVPTPRWLFLDGPGKLPKHDLRFPVILKPNFEGSSKGITQDSVVEDAKDLQARADDVLSRYPTGLLVEEYIVGRDVVVPYLESISPKTGGVLEPAEYEYRAPARKYQIYDYHLKQVGFDDVHVKVPAELPAALREEMMRQARTVYRVLGIRDVGRIDFRVSDSGELFFIEVNALPSLEKGASLYLSSKLAGVSEDSGVFAAVVASAAKRHGLSTAPSRDRRRKRLRIGLTFNLKRTTPDAAGLHDEEAEFDSPKTIEALREALESYDHEVVELEATPELPAILAASGIDVAFNVAEGIRGRNRESHIPAMLELLGIAYTGSDPSAMALALDKGLAKRVVGQAGVTTPNFVLMLTGKEPLPRDFRFPAVIKPVAEGSSKGVLATSLVDDETTLRASVRRMTEKYRQATLVEEYLSGREFTVALLGEHRPRVLPPMEIVFTPAAGERPLYTFDFKLAENSFVRNDAPAKIDDGLKKELERAAKMAFKALGCRDVARIDFRLDATGRPSFLECNPLPGLTPGWSDLCLIAAGAGMDYRTLIGEILAPAIRRYREGKRADQKAAD